MISISFLVWIDYGCHLERPDSLLIDQIPFYTCYLNYFLGLRPISDSDQSQMVVQSLWNVTLYEFMREIFFSLSLSELSFGFDPLNCVKLR